MHRPAGFGFRDRAGGHRSGGGFRQRRHAAGSGLGLEGGGVGSGGNAAALRFRHGKKLGQRQPPRRARAVAGGAARLQQPQFAEAGVAGSADDEVVVDGDTQRLGGGGDRLGHLDVGAAGGRVAARVVVHHPVNLVIYLIFIVIF